MLRVRHGRRRHLGGCGRLGSLVVLSALAACGQSKSGLEPPPAQSAGAAGVGGAAFEPCFDPASVVSCHDLFPNETPSTSVVLGEAADFGEGAHFAQLGGWAALVRFEDGRPPRLALAELDSTLSTFEIDTSDDAGELAIVGVWGEAFSSLSDSVAAVAVALGCNEARCQLLAAAERNDALRALPGYELPATVRAEGILSDRGRVCVYGEGLYCVVDDGWSTVLDPAVTGRLVAASLDYPAAVATAEGRLFLEDPESGAWSSLSVVVGPARSLDRTWGTVSVLTDAAWVAVSTEPEASATCEPSPPLSLASPGSSLFGVPWLVVDEHATVYRQRQTYAPSGEREPSLTWCIASAGPSETVRGVQAAPCNDGTNLLAISDERFYSLFGVLACPLR